MPPTIARDRLVLSHDTSSRKLWGILTRKERWGLSWRGWLLLTSAGLVATYFAFLNVHPFLAVTHRVDTNVLVVEGWIQRSAIGRGAEEFRTGSYQRIFTTGGPARGLSSYVNDFQTSASVGAEALKKLGLSDEVVQMVPSHVIARDRTYSSAVALRDWFRDHNAAVRSFNVVTEDTHARRTRLLFQEAFGEGVKVGIIAVPSPDYDAKHWWRYSEGVKDVISEGAAYLYAKFFFWPGAAEPREKGDGSLPQADKLKR